MVQLQHLKTGKFVSIDVNKLASHEKDALHCHVTTDENQNCWLGIFPRYSVRMVGDPVQIKMRSNLGAAKKRITFCIWQSIKPKILNHFSRTKVVYMKEMQAQKFPGGGYTGMRKTIPK